MRKPIIIGNWKMNPATQTEAVNLAKDVDEGVKDIKNVETVVCPPAVFLSAVGATITNVHLGSQNVFWEESGTYTGEVSPTMLRDSGCKYVIVGHSERREYLGETNEMVNKKVIACLKNGLQPILCIGENLMAKEEKKTEIVLREQLNQALKSITPEQVKNIIVTYEPIWAISKGTKDTRNPAQPAEVVKAIKLMRGMLSQLYNADLVREINVIYGGSVDSQNAGEFLEAKEIDGALVGGASLNAEEFIRIVKKVA